MAAAGSLHDVFEQTAQTVSVALHHGRGRIARAQQPAKIGIEFDQHQPRRIDAALNHRFRHRAGAGSEFDNRAGAERIDIARHHARQRLARRHHSAGAQRFIDPGTKKLHLVIETQRLFFNAGNVLQWH